MKILLTGTTGYIGKRLLPVLLDAGHHVVCCVRDKNRFDAGFYESDRVSVVEVDFLDAASLAAIPADLDAAYYLIHSMSAAVASGISAVFSACAFHASWLLIAASGAVSGAFSSRTSAPAAFAASGVLALAGFALLARHRSDSRD